MAYMMLIIKPDSYRAMRHEASKIGTKIVDRQRRLVESFGERVRPLRVRKVNYESCMW